MANRKKRTQTKYNVNLMSGKIRRILQENPDAGYDAMEREFGPLDRSIRVTFYRIHKEMFGTPGSLKRGGKKAAPIRNKVIRYFADHPDHTINQCAAALGFSHMQVYEAIYRASMAGTEIPHKKQGRGPSAASLSHDIREYFLTHPETTIRECARHVGAKPGYVSLIVYHARKSGILPTKTKHRGENYGVSV